MESTPDEHNDLPRRRQDRETQGRLLTLERSSDGVQRREKYAMALITFLSGIIISGVVSYYGVLQKLILLEEQVRVLTVQIAELRKLIGVAWPF